MTIAYSIGGIILLAAAIFWYWLWYTEPKLPANFAGLIKTVLDAEIPELMPGEKGFTQNGNIKLLYEVMKPDNPPKGSILFVCGLSRTLLDWPDFLYQPLLKEGYQIIRFDNRGVGESDWMKNWTKETAYTLEDMATDAIAVLDALEIEQAHVVGMSMGGMISQRIAISYPERVLSLTSIMSTGFYFDPELTDLPKPFYWKLTKLVLRYLRTMKDIRTKLKFQYGVRQILKGKGDYELDHERALMQTRYEVERRNGYNPTATDQHSMAIKKSGSRYEELKQLDVPTLVVHGTDDTLVLFEHGQKYAPMIPNSVSLFIDGMGHDLPKAYAPKILNSILEVFTKSNVNQK